MKTQKINHHCWENLKNLQVHNSLHELQISYYGTMLLQYQSAQYISCILQEFWVLNFWDLRLSERCCWRFKFSGRSHRAVRRLMPNILKDHHPFTFRTKQSTNTDDEGALMLWNFQNYSSNGRVSYPRKLGSLIQFATYPSLCHKCLSVTATILHFK